MTNIDNLLNPEEKDIYRLNRRENKDIETIVAEDKSQKYTYEEVQNILNRIDKKAILFSRYDALHYLVSTYSLACEMGKTYYEEKYAGINHEFNIDYSDIHAYLYPVEAMGNQNKIISNNDLGSINYMLESASKKKYFMTPPTIYELIKKLDLMHDDVVQLSNLEINKHGKIAEFCKVVDSWDGKNPEVFSGKLMEHYIAMGNFLDILALVDEKQLGARLAHNYSTVKTLLDGIIPPMGESLAEDIGQIETKEGIEGIKSIYSKALSKLNDCRPYFLDETKKIYYRDENNEIDAANFAITYNLTEKHGKDTFYRFVSHSRQHAKAFRNIRYGKKSVSCCPQCVSTLISIKQNSITGIDDNDWLKKSRYMAKNMRILDNIRNQYQLPHYKGLYEIKDIEDKNAFMENTLKPFYNHMLNFTKFTAQVYPSFIGQIMRINSGVQENYDRYFEEDVRRVRRIFNQQAEYSKIMKDAIDLIHEDLKTTFDGLCKHLDGGNEKLLTENMRKKLKNIEKKAHN
ncbi:MAG: hypothetical protein FWG55_05555 [Candidatus Bathyarchaeota archaeon]|nr:hypothetical protein [Candidatus Termiticorpusculum sp.]